MRKAFHSRLESVRDAKPRVKKNNMGVNAFPRQLKQQYNQHAANDGFRPKEGVSFCNKTCYLQRLRLPSSACGEWKKRDECESFIDSRARTHLN